MRTYVYIDGFNLYYRALKGTPYKWLDLKKIASSVLNPNNDVKAIKYYTARVTGLIDPDAPRRQHTYLKAIQTIPEVEIFYGHFLAKKIRRPLTSGSGQIVEVFNNEEKGSDVNLASHVIHDGWRGVYDVAVVISNDTDLCEPIRIVTKELKKPVGVICPASSCSPPLRKVASFVKHFNNSRLASSQFPDEIPGTGIKKPTTW